MMAGSVLSPDPDRPKEVDDRDQQVGKARRGGEWRFEAASRGGVMIRRLVEWFRRDDAALQDEIRAHIEMETAENLERGLTPEEARRAAQRTFGNVSVLRESIRILPHLSSRAGWHNPAFMGERRKPLHLSADELCLGGRSPFAMLKQQQPANQPNDTSFGGFTSIRWLSARC